LTKDFLRENVGVGEADNLVEGLLLLGLLVKTKQRVRKGGIAKLLILLVSSFSRLSLFFL
jgi:hypothetical protein